MFRVALKSILGHKLRIVLTAFAVVLGVAFFSGTRVFTDTILAAFDELFAEANEGVDAQVRSAKSLSDPFGQEQRGEFTAQALPVVRDAEGVDEAEGSVFGWAIIVDRDGEAINASGNGPPPLGFAWGDVADLNPLRIVEGEPPRAADDIVVDRFTADDNNFSVGEKIRVLTKAGSSEYTLSGIVTFGSADSPLGATIVAFTPGIAQRVLGTPDHYLTVEATADDGVSEEELRDSILADLEDAGYAAVAFSEDGPPDTAELEVLTGDEVRAESQDEVRQQLSFFTTFLFVFVIVALVVSTFVIYNSFSITIAQRRREMGLLRAIGAGRRQVLWGVLVEALATGVVASVLGLLAGVGLAVGLKSLLEALDVDIPSTSPVVNATTIVTSLLLGIFVTLVAAVFPAWRASRIPPIAALRDVTLEPTTNPVWRYARSGIVVLFGLLSLVSALGTGTDRGYALARGLVLAGLGVAFLLPFATDVRAYRVVRAVGVLLFGLLLMLQGLFGATDSGLQLVGAGALTVFIAVALFSSLIARPVASILGRRAVGVVVMGAGGLLMLGALALVVNGASDSSIAGVIAGVVVGLFAWAYWRSGVAAFGMSGKLGRENAMRNPLRTGRTSSALMIGIGLVAMITVFAASARAAITEIIGEQVSADYVVNSGFGVAGMSPELARELGEVPGVQTADGVRGGVVTEYQPDRDPGDEPVRFVSAVDPSKSTDLWDLGFVEGDEGDIGPGDVALWEDRADDLEVEVGDTVDLGFLDTGRQTLDVVAIYENNELAGDYVVSLETWEENVNDQFDFIVAVKLDSGVDVEAIRPDLEAVVDKYPNGTLETREEFESSQADQINGFLNLIYGLLLFAIIISAFGIANTLALSIFERTRELGLLRAVGMNRSQVRRMVRWEAVVVALLGTALGVAIGVFFSWILIQSLSDQGFNTFSVPYVQVFFVLVFGAGVGIVSALLPAYRAARLDMLDAIATE